jgi:hypothetical protein
LAELIVTASERPGSTDNGTYANTERRPPAKGLPPESATTPMIVSHGALDDASPKRMRCAPPQHVTDESDRFRTHAIVSRQEVAAECGLHTDQSE